MIQNENQSPQIPSAITVICLCHVDKLGTDRWICHVDHETNKKMPRVSRDQLKHATWTN